jgi:hypothetical protein
MILVGEKNIEDGMAKFAKLVDLFLERYDPVRTKEQLQAVLDELPEPSWVQMRFLLGVFKYLPQMARYGFQKIATKVEEDDTIPQIPRGRPGLDTFTKEKIVAYVGKLHMKGFSLALAKQRATREFRVSEAAVKRAWDDRGNSGEVDFRSVIKFLAEEMSNV